jgi:hypothetical protein
MEVTGMGRNPLQRNEEIKVRFSLWLSRHPFFVVYTWLTALTTLVVLEIWGR